MTRFARGLMLFATLWMLSGCTSTGSSASPPSGGLIVTPGDGRVTLTWAVDPSVQYWAFYVAGSSISSDDPTSTPGHVNIMNVTSPLVIGCPLHCLANGTTYAFTVNGRVNFGPQGAGTPSVSAVPRLTGSSWTVGAPLGAFDLNGIAYGTLGGNIFVAAGAGGKIASSPDGLTWTSLSNTASAADLNAVAFGGSIYVAAGAGGVMLYSTDGINWTAATSATGNNINGLATNGLNGFVGVGAGGTIVYSSNGTTWTAATSGTTNDLLAVTYGSVGFVAVGTGGTLLTSADGVTWTAVASNTGRDLRSVTYGYNASTGTTLFVAAGALGALVASPNGTTWTSYASLPVSNINSIAYGTQFVLVGDSGIIYTSTDGTSWQVQASGTGNNLRAVARNANTYSYSAVGVSGTNLSAY